MGKCSYCGFSVDSLISRGNVCEECLSDNFIIEGE